LELCTAVLRYLNVIADEQVGACTCDLSCDADGLDARGDVCLCTADVEDVLCVKLGLVGFHVGEEGQCADNALDEAGVVIGSVFGG
jgi:hypothetical protein